MKRILLDENVPIGLAALLGSADVQHVHALGWSGVSDETLIARAIQAGFEVLVTSDQNLPFQQKLEGLALVVVDTNNWNLIQAHADDVRRAVAAARPGQSSAASIARRSRSRPRIS